MTQRTLSIILCFIIMVCNICATTAGKKKQPAQKSTLRTIVIDPGHGGKDEGAHGPTSYEKDVCLAVALKLKADIEAEMPGINVVMTRTTDTYPSLYARANMANAAKGDLFISIRCQGCSTE